MSKAFRKICLHHQALYETKNKEPDDVNKLYKKLSSFYLIEFYLYVFKIDF